MARLLTAFALTVAVPAAGFAQAGPSFGAAQGPAVSPYLNLLRTNNPTYLNYYGLVQPQVQFNQAQQQLQGQVAGLDQSFTTFSATPAGPFGGLASNFATGHGFGFQTYRGYFQTQFRGGVGVGGQQYGGQGSGGQAGFNTTGTNVGGQNLGGFRR